MNPSICFCAKFYLRNGLVVQGQERRPLFTFKGSGHVEAENAGELIPVVMRRIVHLAGYPFPFSITGHDRKGKTLFLAAYIRRRDIPLLDKVGAHRNRKTFKHYGISIQWQPELPLST